MKYDIAVIGAGPGGYTAAAKAGRLGRSVVLFEKSQLGGYLPEPGLYSYQGTASFGRASG